MKRFWSEVTAVKVDRGWQIMLDGRPIKTQGGAEQIVPSAPLAEALADEWHLQGPNKGDEIDPAGFVLRDMADYAIDHIRPDRTGAIAKLLAFADTDTLCYRADPEDALYRKQQEVWEPLVADFEQREGVALTRVSGIVHRPAPQETLAKLRARLETLDDFTLAAVQPLASLSASLCIALSVLEPGADIDTLWNAANLEEEWQADLWGRDEEAEEARAKKRAEFAQAARFAALAGRA
ncbi:MAG: ATP12 family protein [Alteripontixanthobacter sp.]